MLILAPKKSFTSSALTPPHPVHSSKHVTPTPQPLSPALKPYNDIILQAHQPLLASPSAVQRWGGEGGLRSGAGGEGKGTGVGVGCGVAEGDVGDVGVTIMVTKSSF